MEPVRSETTNKVDLELENEKGYVLLSPLVVVDKMNLIVIVSLGWVTYLTRPGRWVGCVELGIFFPGGRGLTRTRCLFPVSSSIVDNTLCLFHIVIVNVHIILWNHIVLWMGWI